MKTNYSGQKIVANGETIYIGEPAVDLTLSSGMHIFVGCEGTITITSSSVIVFAEHCRSLHITNSVGAKTYRGGYALGDLFLTTSEESPSARVGGTWQMITADAYLKIVSGKAGGMGGTNTQHIIPIESMPSHGKHLYDDWLIPKDGTAIAKWLSMGTFQTYGDVGRGWNELANGEMYPAGYSAGGTNPYYPYYYGVHVWKRIKYQNQE